MSPKVAAARFLPPGAAMTRAEPLTRQTWKNRIALHWPIPGELLRPLLPPALTPALLDGHCRVTLSAFDVAEVSAPSLPLPKLPPFSQVEVRTYAQDASGTIGVWYLALAASSLAAATAARAGFGLDYRTAAISIESDGGEEPLVTVEARADRPDPVACTLAIRGAAGTAIPPPGTLEQLLLLPSRAWVSTEAGLAAIDTERGPARVSRGTVEVLEETWLWSVGIQRPPSAALAHVIREESIAIHAPAMVTER
jgi:uncharacterized protein